MGRVPRNYLISFLIIGLFFLVAHLINRTVEQNLPANQPEIPKGKGEAN